MILQNKNLLLAKFELEIFHKLPNLTFMQNKERLLKLCRIIIIVINYFMNIVKFDFLEGFSYPFQFKEWEIIESRDFP